MITSQKTSRQRMSEKQINAIALLIMLLLIPVIG
jgi:hypothetical protein